MGTVMEHLWILNGSEIDLIREQETNREKTVKKHMAVESRGIPIENQA